MTNLIRRDAVASLRGKGRSPEQPRALKAKGEATFGRLTWLRTERREGEAEEAERPVAVG